jgi:hypothetical protein
MRSLPADHPRDIQLNREASMKTRAVVAFVLASTLTAGAAAAHPAPFNEIGVTMGHWHIVADRQHHHLHHRPLGHPHRDHSAGAARAAGAAAVGPASQA